MHICNIDVHFNDIFGTENVIFALFYSENSENHVQQDKNETL